MTSADAEIVLRMLNTSPTVPPTPGRRQGTIFVGDLAYYYYYGNPSYLAAEINHKSLGWTEPDAMRLVAEYMDASSKAAARARR